MAKSKIEIGQCYEKNDHIYMIVEGPYVNVWKEQWWCLENTLSKTIRAELEKDVLTWRRPFQNFG